MLYGAVLAQELCKDFYFAWGSWAELCKDFYFAVRNKNPYTAKNEFPDTGCPGPGDTPHHRHHPLLPVSLQVGYFTFYLLFPISIIQLLPVSFPFLFPSPFPSFPSLFHIIFLSVPFPFHS